MPSLRILEPGDEALLERFLRPRIDSSLFLLNNSRLAGLTDLSRRFAGTYSAALEGEEITGVIAHYWQGNLVLQAPSHLAALLEAIVRAPARPIRGLLGLSDQVGRARELLGWAAPQVQFDEEEGLFALGLEQLIVPEELRSGRVRGRLVERRDLEKVIAWRVAYCLEALEAAETPELREQCRRDITSSFERGETWVLEDMVLEDGGELVASTSFNAATCEAVQVGGVWTPPELRGRGYGRAVVAVSLLEARERSVERAILFTGDDNVPAVKAYAALGFERIGDHRIVLLRAGS